ncbi:branched-chain amino acid ABC transporter permease [Sulfitobacter mediterraneus]|jgi:branched-chain amino acid transport system permease protein|uniref:branched-chain amino acid ABC transporter permease n=1 Tax=Sulfitobacter mediterraneus TaxID=83219 RepID=UPI001931C67E|nr:branched-chain amino acid ABC transporter permease [Sulfitobacter mediterraneus]MBM1635119.1 branched-chain amino acid ABC transporter permease [Sulfitobacter mediterraneus]MBM1642943.1 branched-chain amino acid ABC transporter permease [Sulfitobacter mediterraneus]MBM1646991.1 branched-chain amino acid ABC transporter permease [Sulfitobacter mediterraneus]MBM1651033.1 branched-chain amino acid ABC transporter permease [Sulfitobacter mediterraneus]MBM1655066.1 branched-chain amino acid ABC 
MSDQLTTDPSKPAQRMRAGSMTLTLGPWIVAAIALLVMPYIFTSNSALTIMNQMWITVVFALAYNMLLGQGGMLSFGHAVYMGLGGFFCMHLMNYIEDFGLAFPLPLLPLFGGLFGMGFAMIIGSFSTSGAGTRFAMISLGVGELIAACSVIIVAFFGGEEGISGDRTYGLPFFGVEFLKQIEVYYLISFWLMLSAALMYLFSRTPVGRMANAVRDNPERAQFLGYSARWVRFYSFCASGFFCGIAGGLFAISYEILTEENLNAASSGVILLVTFLGGVGFFFGPIIGAIAFTLLQTVLSLQTDLWAIYVGGLFLATVMFFPGGLAGLMMMHVPAMRLGKASGLIVPYIKTLVPGAIGILGVCALIEMTFHFRHGAKGDNEMTLFWTTFDSHTILPWLIAGVVAAVGLGVARATAPAMKEAWDEANTAGGAS